MSRTPNVRRRRPRRLLLHAAPALKVSAVTRLDQSPGVHPHVHNASTFSLATPRIRILVLVSPR